MCANSSSRRAEPFPLSGSWRATSAARADRGHRHRAAVVGVDVHRPRLLPVRLRVEPEVAAGPVDGEHLGGVGLVGARGGRGLGRPSVAVGVSVATSARCGRRTGCAGDRRGRGRGLGGHDDDGGDGHGGDAADARRDRRQPEAVRGDDQTDRQRDGDRLEDDAGQIDAADLLGDPVVGGEREADGSAQGPDAGGRQVDRDREPCRRASGAPAEQRRGQRELGDAGDREPDGDDDVAPAVLGDHGEVDEAGAGTATGDQPCQLRIGLASVGRGRGHERPLAVAACSVQELSPAGPGCGRCHTERSGDRLAGLRAAARRGGSWSPSGCRWRRACRPASRPRADPWP